MAEAVVRFRRFRVSDGYRGMPLAATLDPNSIGPIKEGRATDGNKLFREIVGLFLLFSGVFLAVSLFSYHPHDPSFFYVSSNSRDASNLAGIFGAHAAGLFVAFLGIGGILVPFLCLYLGALCFVRRLALEWWRGLGIFLLTLTLITWANSPWAVQHISILRASGGGLLGKELFRWSQFLLRPLGALIVWSFILMASIQLTLGISWVMTGRGLHDRALSAWQRRIFKNKSGRSRQPVVPTAEAAKPQSAARASKTDEAAPFEPVSPASELPNDLSFATLFKPEEAGDTGKSDHGQESVGGFLPTFPTELPPTQEPPMEDEPELFAQAVVPQPPSSPASRSYHTAPRAQAAVKAPLPAEPEAEYVPMDTSLPLPSFDLLAKQTEDISGPNMADLEEKAQVLTASLSNFGVNGEVHRIVPGPVVTMFEYKPAPGVKLTRITSLSDDLAMALRAMAVRINAIPGKDLVGIEIPNEDREVVFLRDVFESEGFLSSQSKLTLALGKDIQGKPFVADLAKMPHLLVAGATGAGKSVCLNGILLSLLYKADPDDVKLLLVDPKRIELSVYADLPHLVHPVVTEMAMAKNALEWAVYEMEKRYEAMARLGVRNIDGFNQKLAKSSIQARSDLADLSPMPYLVIVIDELADLMMTAAKEAEMAIVRLAQLARAAGIHLILATQRPSVDVVTGLIKANFPTRISFQVTSKHDSRTILDTVGAEKLLGRGDMLYKPSGGSFLRLHGAYVGEEEIERVVDFWKAKAPQSFELDFTAWQQEGSNEASEGMPEGLDGDPVYQEAVDFVLEQGKASISLIQRRFRIGFNRAARYIEQMEMDGLLGPQEGSKPRQVLRGRE